MSIILTAGKKAVKHNKPKIKKKAHIKTSNETAVPPPMSSSNTVVWHWILEGANTVVMFTKATGAVWCNGTNLTPVESFGAGGHDGAELDFVIVTDRGREHEATIKKMVIQGENISYQLFVDRYMILENMGQPPGASSTQITMDMSETDFPAPPPYGELYPGGQ